MKILRETKEPASIGEYFASFRRRIFKSGKTYPIQGELAGAVDVPGAKRQIAGSKRMVDGVMKLPEGNYGPNGPKKGGRFAVEDKAGQSFDLDQAKRYSAELAPPPKGKGKIDLGDPEACEGIIYFVEDPAHAITIADKLSLNGLHPNIFVATFDDSGGQLRFVPRPPTAKPKGKGAVGRGKKK
jgi:hypothetical protein